MVERAGWSAVVLERWTPANMLSTMGLNIFPLPDPPHGRLPLDTSGATMLEFLYPEREHVVFPNGEAVVPRRNFYRFLATAGGEGCAWHVGKFKQHNLQLVAKETFFLAHMAAASAVPLDNPKHMTDMIVNAGGVQLLSVCHKGTDTLARMHARVCPCRRCGLIPH
eukprot:525873-Amphidinium_carterae.9